jgi:hypothetical protein
MYYNLNWFISSNFLHFYLSPFLMLVSVSLRFLYLPVQVAHTCNPSYSRGKDQEDRSLKPALANSSRPFPSQNNNNKTGLVEWLKLKVLSSSPSTTKKKKDFYIYSCIVNISTLFKFLVFVTLLCMTAP